MVGYGRLLFAFAGIHLSPEAFVEKEATAADAEVQDGRYGIT